MGVTLNLFHDSNGDTCEAIESTVIGIDLTFLKEQYRLQYGQESAELDVRLRGPESSESLRYSF